MRIKELRGVGSLSPAKDDPGEPDDGLLDVGLPDGEDERVGEGLEDDEAVAHHVDVEEGLHAEAAGLEPAT